MTAMRDPRAAYQGNAIATASPARLLVMLVDRLVLDCERGLKALVAADQETANTELQHAQSIVLHLSSTLELDGMPAGRELLSLYDWILRQLIQANVGRDRQAALEALNRSRELSETWSQAALLAVTPGASL